ncbi:MAG: hypothetical protein J1E00_03370 [Oscillospiraceae bacterium]|nr:hypothetical protein [Oscillospiraceae bacterium]
MEETTRMETPATGSLLREILSPEGWCGKLMTPIRRVEILPEKPAEAFKQFLRRIGVGETFTLAELLMAGELLYRREVYGKPGDGIYLLREPMRDPRMMASLMARSVPGLFGLLTAAGGADLHLPAGIGEDRLVYDRLLLLREKDGDRLIASGMVPLIRLGTVVPDQLRLNVEGGDFPVDLSDLLLREPQTLTVEEEGDYLPAIHAVLGYGCCAALPGKYYVNLASDRSLAQMFTGAVGLFEAMLKFHFPLPPMRFHPNGNTGLVVPRPMIYSGDSVYVFRPHLLPNGDPAAEEYQKLRMFLLDGFRTKKVRSVLPMKGNTPSLLRKLGGSEFTFTEDAPLPIGQFAMLGILPFGEQPPGTRVGYYEPADESPESEDTF